MSREFRDFRKSRVSRESRESRESRDSMDSIESTSPGSPWIILHKEKLKAQSRIKLRNMFKILVSKDE